jgi:hypothetical protein
LKRGPLMEVMCGESVSQWPVRHGIEMLTPQAKPAVASRRKV